MFYKYSLNAPPMTEIGQETDPLKIAEKELNEKKVYYFFVIIADRFQSL